MNNKGIIIGLIVLVIIIGAAFYYSSRPQPQSDILTVASYSDGTTTVEATFNQSNDTVTFTQNAGGAITLPRAVSASGARYANDDESLVFWEHQGELTITTNGTETFKGHLLTDTAQGTPLLGTWVWEKTVTPTGAVVTPKKPEAFTLTFNSDSTVSGTTDCNGFSGTYSQPTAGAITFGPLASTKMFCEGSQEADFTSPFSQVRNYVVSGATLTLKLAGSGEMAFKKK